MKASASLEPRLITIRRAAAGTPFEKARLVDIHATMVNDYMAVHPSVSLDRDDWTVTHLPTGFLMSRASSKVAAIEAARALDRLGADWNFDHPRVVESWPGDLRQKIFHIRDLATAGDIANLRGLP